MTRLVQGPKSKGSQRWIQQLVNCFPNVLNDAIGVGPIAWHSPLEADGYAEYRDDMALDRLGVQPTRRLLQSFWPKKGPRWDALGRARSGHAILVEAKAHIGEIFSRKTIAHGANLIKIQAALNETKSSLRAKCGLEWSLRFYQHTNRLAHGFFLHRLNGIPCWLVFLYIIGDSAVNGPKTRAEWESATRLLYAALGLPRRPASFIRDAFIDVSGRKPIAVH